MALTKVPSNLDAAVSTTQSQADNSTKVATTAYVDLAISNLSDSAPAALNTLNEIAAALGDDANYASTTTAAIAAKLPLAGGTMTGTLNMVHASFAGNVTTVDNALIQLGAGNDLILTHNGTNSQIKNMTGRLELLSDSSIIMQDAGANETFAVFNDNGAVVLNHDNVAKLSTTSTGTHTSGTFLSLKTTSSTANDRAGAGFSLTESSTDSSRLAQMYLDADNGAFGTGDSGTYFYIEKKGGGGEVNFINQDNAALNFQTNGSHKRLTISGNNLHLNGGTDARIQLGTSGAGATSTSNDTVHIRGDGDSMKLMTAANGHYIFEENGNQHMRINSGGDIAIGTHSPGHDVHIKRDASESTLAIQSNIGGTGSAYGGRLRLQLGAQSNSGSGNADTEAGDVLGQIMFEGQGTDYSYQGGNIKTIVTTGDGNDDRSAQAAAMTFETISTGSVSPEERMRITPTGLHTTGGLHEIYSATPNNFVGGCAADAWHDITNYNYQNQHNGPGVDHTAQTITQLVWQNNSSTYGYIVRMWVIHGAYSANTHTVYSSGGTNSVLDGGSSFSHIYTGKYDTPGNGALVYATLHTSSNSLKLGVRFNNHTTTNYGALTMQVQTNAPPAAGTSPIMRIWRI